MWYNHHPKRRLQPRAILLETSNLCPRLGVIWLLRSWTNGDNCRNLIYVFCASLSHPKRINQWHFKSISLSFACVKQSIWIWLLIAAFRRLWKRYSWQWNDIVSRLKCRSIVWFWVSSIRNWSIGSSHPKIKAQKQWRLICLALRK